ncbi:MAG: hypothetical protein WBA57_09115 [Elainellaceae cyanobacterium]
MNIRNIDTARRPSIQSLSLIDRVYLANSFRLDAFRRPLASIWQWLTHDVEEFKVWTTKNYSGQLLWHAVDRRTGQSLYNVSEDDMRQWVEHRISGSLS